MAIDVATMQTHLEAARVALGTGDYAAAEMQCLQAQACLAGLPDGRGGEHEMSWRESINTLLLAIRSAKRSELAAGGGLQRTLITYVPAADEE